MRETAKQYKQRILGYTAGRDPARIQRATPARLARLLRGVPRPRLARRPAPGKWSVAEIVAHLADVELVAGYRLRLVVGAPGTPIQPFDQDRWAVAGRYGKRDPKRSLAHFSALREANLAFYRSLAPAQRKRYGMHAERGRETVADIFQLLAGHDLNHLRQIEAILAGSRAR